METSQGSHVVLRLYGETRSACDATVAEPSMTVLDEALRKMLAKHASAGTDPCADPDVPSALRAFVARLRDAGCSPETVVVSVKALLRRCQPRGHEAHGAHAQAFRRLHEAVVLATIKAYFQRAGDPESAGA